MIAYRGATATDDVSAVAWDVAGDDLPFTRLNFTEAASGDATAHSEIWYLVTPTVKTADVTVTLGTSRRICATVSSYSGVHQTTPFNNEAVNDGDDTAPTVSVTGTASGSMLVDAMAQVSAGPDAATVDPSQTQRSNVASPAAGGQDTRLGSSEESSSGGTVAMDWSMAGSDDWAISAGELVEPAGAPEAGRTLWSRPISVGIM